MHPVTTEVMAARHADLLREAERARRVAEARRRGAMAPAPWRSRVGALLIGLGEAVAGRQPAVLALSQTERCS